ncbi:hypothetical protein EDC01DRAFT_616861, partial [Geopyxis carbonaria]
VPRQVTLVPLIFSSDETHLTNFSGGKKEWPVYMTIGNLDATQAKQVLYTVLGGPPEPLNQSAYPEHKGRPVDMLCAHRSVRSYWPVLAAWIANHPEHTNLQGTKENVCPTCTLHRTNLGELNP